MQVKQVNGRWLCNHSAVDQLFEVHTVKWNSSASRSVLPADLKNLTDL